MSEDMGDKTLLGMMTVRVFPEMLSQIDAAILSCPGRWENQSHFIRAAVAHFLHYLETEEGFLPEEVGL